MSQDLVQAPVLSTPDNHILTGVDPINVLQPASDLSEERFWIQYEIQRTIDEIKANKWRRVALQFPDHMLPHSSRVFETLSRETRSSPAPILKTSEQMKPPKDQLGGPLSHLESQLVKFTILADTSYGSCCVDEIAAEHVDADAVIHYGRACLSPTSRLPVLHVFTCAEIDESAAVLTFTNTFPDLGVKIILTADTPYDPHVQAVWKRLVTLGYSNVFAAEILHDPTSIIPNRSIPASVSSNQDCLSDWHLFHIAEPPTALLLTLSSKVRSILIYDPQSTNANAGSKAQETNTAVLLRRRYALVTSMNTVSTWGILINTLSVKNYLHVVDHVKQQIAGAGKKSYLFVVGKLNAAKVANFSEIGGWVVIGCWESSLIDSRDFYKPILTPFELQLALASDNSRVWSGSWRSDFQALFANAEQQSQVASEPPEDSNEDKNEEIYGSEEESAPPEFDLRTGKYVSQTRPMAIRNASQQSQEHDSATNSNALTRRANGDLIAVNGIASPAAEFLAQHRSWKGLGSDFEIQHEDEEIEGSLVEEGRSGMARGYTVGDSVRS